MRCCCDTSGPSVQVSPVDQQEHVLRVRRWAPDDWLHALAWAKEGAHPRYGAIWIFCAPHEHPAPSAPPGRKDTTSSSTIVCMGAKRCTRRGLRSGSQRERRLGGGKFSLLSLGARKHSLLIARFPCPLNSSARGVLLQVDVVAEAAISASTARAEVCTANSVLVLRGRSVHGESVVSWRECVGGLGV